MPDLRLTLAQAIRAERSRLKLTQDQLADAVGVERHVITSIEAGQRRIGMDEAPAICRALGVTLDRLYIDADADDRDALGL